MQKFEHVFVDLDGTLIDHFDAIHQSFSFAAETLGLTIPTYEKVLRTVGGSVPITASKLFPGVDTPSVVELFETHFDRVMYDAVEVIPGANWLLEELHKTGVHLIVFTNKRGDKARKICEYLGMTKWLTGIIGTGDTAHRKPEKAFSQYALDTFGAHPQKSCMVGDSPFDEQAAIVVDMKCHLVSTGSHDTQTLRNETQSDVHESLFALGQEVFGLAVPVENA